MNKLISISPQTMLALAAGAPLRTLNIPACRDAKIVKCGYNNQSNEFWVEVQLDSFDDRFSEKRLPQEFRIEAQKF